MLLDEGISDIHPSTKKIITEGNNEVSLWGKPDVFRHDGVPIEFKVNGASSATGQSPNPGYKVAKFSDGKIKNYHDRYGEPLEALNREWAIQLFIYNMMHNSLLPFRNYKYRLEQVAVRPTTTCFASFEGVISKEFAEQTWGEIVAAWKNIQEGDIPSPSPCKGLCHKYNQICEVSHICGSYKHIHNDPTLKAMMF